MIHCYYRIIIADITNATKHLDPAYSDKSPSPERDTAEAEHASQQFLTTQEAQAAIICDLSLLPNVMTASRSVKGVGGYTVILVAILYSGLISRGQNFEVFVDFALSLKC